MTHQQHSAPHGSALSDATATCFRDATCADIAAMSVVRLAVTENQLSDPNRITPQMYEDYLSRRGQGWVCVQAGRVVGFAIADRLDASIWALFVLPEAEGRGIGRELLQRAVNWLWQAGLVSVRLSTGADTRAARFYRQLGWQPDGETADGELCFVLHRSGAGAL